MVKRWLGQGGEVLLADEAVSTDDEDFLCEWLHVKCYASQFMRTEAKMRWIQ